MRILGLVAGQRREELARTGFGDGAEMFNGFFTRQADTVIGDRDGPGFLVEGDADFQFGIVAIE